MNKNLQTKLLKITENYESIQKQLSSTGITNEKRIEGIKISKLPIETITILNERKSK